MNLHQPQNILAETELRHLAAIQHQLISPSGNSPIIGIFQDGMIGSYRFTRSNINFTPREAMNLLMMYPNVDVNALRAKGNKISSFDIISQILPPMTLKYKTNLYDEDTEDYATSNSVVEIQNGKYVRGQIDKSVFGSTTKGIIHRICNDFGNSEAAKFIDNMQNIVTEYMKSSSFSVGISDLIANKATQDSITQVLSRQKQEVQSVIDKVHLGIFENNTAATNFNAFETTVNNILNEACNESGKIGRKSLSKTNRFVMIVNSGSKGSPLNISQMISCLGQTNVDGKRIAYGFDSRTLPHFSKFDDSPNARGFIENSYISGLTAPELFFHAMGGRIGLIDTAVKSVTWETPIVIIENGQPKYTEIGRWIDQHIDTANPLDVQHFTERQMELLNTSEIYIPTTDEDGFVTWGEITAVTRHDPGDQLYEIKTTGGRSVIVTESKSLLIWNPETKKLKEKLTPDIKVGDAVPVTGELCEPPIRINTMVEPTTGETVILDFDYGNKIASEKQEFPIEAYIANDDFIFGLLTGYFSSDQSVVTDNTVEFYSKSKKLVEGINMLCSRFGIYGGVKQDNDYYVVVISDQWGKLLSEKIILTNKEKDDKMRTITWGVSEFDTYNNVVLDRIVEINLIDPKLHPKVYDLTIPSTLNFGLANGLQVRDTSQTGYIQRRLIKGLEDLKVEYDMTVRNNMNKIIQFSYGDDGFDSTKAENQSLPLVGLSTEDIYLHYDIIGINDQTTGLLKIYSKSTATRMKRQRNETKEVCKKWIDYMIMTRANVINAVFKNKSENTVRVPVAFQNIINNIQGQLSLNANSIVDITPLEAFQLIDEYYEKINQVKYVPTTALFKVLYYYYLTPKELITVKRFHRKGLTVLLETILLKYKQAIVHPGEMVGIIAGQSLGEPTTQLTLNSVTYETEILVRNREGEIEKVQIGEFTERGIKTSQKIEYMQDKDTTYAELPDYYEVPSANEQGETVWRRIEAVTRHPVINEDGTNTMLKVTTKGCREVTVTKAKSLLKLVDGKIQQVNGGDLQVGDYLPCSRKPLEYKEQHVLNLKEILSPKHYIYTSEIEKAREYVSDYYWWSKYHGDKFTLPYSRSDSAYIVVADKRTNDTKHVEYKPGMVYTKSNNICNYMIPEKIDLDYDFGYLVGAYAAEGCMTAHQISISNNDLDYFVPIKRICERYNLTTKIYVHENKNKEGWKSTDIRIYSTLMSHILAKLCGKLSHGKFVSPKIVFSNPECIRGYMDAYISGDGCVTADCKNIDIVSVSYQLLLDTQIMAKNLGAVGKILKITKLTSNNRGTKEENIQQPYMLSFNNKQAKNLAGVLNLTIKNKQERINKMLTMEPKLEYTMFDLKLPNCIDGNIVLEERNGRMMDLAFDQVLSIEEVPNTTNYAYDLTVEDTRNFDIFNSICVADTFHSSGISSKSNVTRGVPRIEEILRLTKNPKNPSLTVHLKPTDEQDKNKATQYATMMEHTKLIDVVKSVQVCFDPIDKETTIDTDKLLMQQYYEFEDMIDECLGVTSDATEAEMQAKSKWLIRMEIDAEALLEKNITMDDIHFAITTSHSSETSCVFSDYNDNNLVFRIRLNNTILNKNKKKGVPETLDQSDEIYILRNFQDTLLNSVVLRGVTKIRNVSARKLQGNVIKDEGKYVRKDIWVLDTTGSNLMSVLALDYIDATRTYSNDIKEIYDVLGIEAAKQVIFNEFSEVMEFSGGIYINYHHLSTLCDRMCCTSDMVPIFRSGILSEKSSILGKSSFEVHTEVLLGASRHADFDQMRGVSANVMFGQNNLGGTGSFSITIDPQAFENMDDKEVVKIEKKLEIEKIFEKIEDPTDICSKKNTSIKNNLGILSKSSIGIVDDDYDIGF